MSTYYLVMVVLLIFIGLLFVYCFTVFIVNEYKESRMPRKMEEALKKEALKKFGSTTSPRARRYIYGTMHKEGWKPKK